MAPIVAQEQNAPLADYFFIAGIESSQVLGDRSSIIGQPVPSPTPVDTTIEENEVLEMDHSSRPKSSDGQNNRHSTASSKKGARLSFEARKSISSLLGCEVLTESQRSSTTPNGAQTEAGIGLSEQDFDTALRKFAAERESFLDEIQFSAGALPKTNKPKARAKTQRIYNEEPGSIKSGVGSLRRRLTTMNSLKRQPSVMRQSSVRTSRRLSGYNSVIPSPQPLHTDPNMHPLKRRYEPVLLDRYPPKIMVEEMKRRANFPDYIPMFAFPNDVNVVSSDERPRSTWHGFAMTNADGSRLHGICMIVWMPLNEKASEALERSCEEWRRANMTDEERELASSLGERLALERAKLSRLLSTLPNVAQGTEEREMLQEQISDVEEKIGLMADLLRPVRHGAASKIEGLTDGETGLWIPRAYGILGREGALTGFWKEWLKAVIVPMTNGGVSRVPASSPKIGMWQPLERYVINLCAEATSPISSITQVEIAVRELRLYARKEALNEIPGCRNTDLYPLFRCLNIANIVTLMEYVLSESRIILLSSHTSMLHLASAALVSLIYPLKWAGVFIPVLPARLIQALEAPCPYIVGIERRYEQVEFPEDDFVLVDLDNNTIESTGPPTPFPRQQRRKLLALLHLSATHHTRYGVPLGPPAHAQEAYPNGVFASENPSVFTHRAAPSTLPTLVSLNSASYGQIEPPTAFRPLVFNAFLQARAGNSRGSEHRPATSSTGGHSRRASPPSPSRISPVSAHFPQPLTPMSGQFPLPSTPISRSDSGFGLQVSLREKRSAHFNDGGSSRRSSSFGFERLQQRRPSQTFLSHIHTPSTSTVNSEVRATSSYAPSVYAHSTLAASTVMPGFHAHPVPHFPMGQCVEGHAMQGIPDDERNLCAICEEPGLDGMLGCNACSLTAHSRCTSQISIVCPNAFRPDQIRSAFVRCFASMFYTYRRFLQFATPEQRKNGLLYHFNMEAFFRSVPHECAQYLRTLEKTQAFNEFIHERELQKGDEPSIRLFDQIILSKKNRGKTSFFSKASTDFLSDTSQHLWRTAAATPPNSRFPGDYRHVISRIPAKLDATLMKEPRVIQGVPRVLQTKARRKPIPSMLGIA